MRLMYLRGLKKRGHQTLFLIPFVCTFANAFLGFLAIIKALEGNCIVAAYCIIFAWIMDIADGNLARAFGSTSTLGMELDSLCDAISFCLAPTMVLYCRYEVGLTGVGALGLYLCMGLFRLARFNSTSQNQFCFFSGLPTPIAALFLASLALDGVALARSPLSFFLYHTVFIAVIAVIAFLMISPVQFPTFKQRIMSVKATLVMAPLVVVSGIVGLVQGYPVLFITMSIYIVMSCLRWGYYKMARRVPYI